MSTIRSLIESNVHTKFRVDFWVKDFIRTGNPFSAMQAYLLSQRFDLEIPSEVLSYLNRVIEGILKLAENPPSPQQRPVAVAKVLGIHGGKRGKGSVWMQHKNRKTVIAEEYRIALETQKWIDYFGAEEYAFDEVAKEEGKSPSTIGRIYRNVSKWW
jgi:hypothetical protein